MRFNRGSRCGLMLAVLFFTLVITNVQAQEEDMTRRFGLSAYVNMSQTQIMIPIWLGDNFTLAPGFSLQYVENSFTTIGILLAPRFYSTMARVTPYVGSRAGVIFNLIDNAKDTTDLLLGIAAGGEYFVNAKFSFGVEAQLNGFVSDVSTARNISLSTAAAVHANVYF